MIKSMTGYGRGERVYGDIKCICEAKSLNHRFLEINVRLPQSLSSYEWEIRRMASSLFSRGRIDINVKIEGALEGEVCLELNIPILKEYLKLIAQLKERFNIPGEPSIDSILRLKDVIIFKEKEEWQEGIKEALIGAVSDSLNALRVMRIEEGRGIEESIRQGIRRIEGFLKEIREKKKESVKAYIELLRSRIKGLVEDIKISEERLYQEATLLAERYDITEEVSRVVSHMEQFRTAIESEGTTGRKLDFLLQEITREINTISAKAQDIAIIRNALEIKNELEKLREQIQNVE